MLDSGDGVSRLAGQYSLTAEQYQGLWAPVLERFNVRLLGELPLERTRRILDVGAGVGTLLPHIQAAAPKARVIGIDRADGMIARAPREFPLVVGDAAQLPMAPAVFDVAVLAFMLFHIPDPHGALTEVQRVLVPAGTIGLTTWGTARPFLGDDVWTDELDAHEAPPDNVTSNRRLMDSPEKLAGLLEDAGFRAETIHVEPFQQTMTVDELMALKSSLGTTARRLALLDSQARTDCMARVRGRLEVLDEDALTDHDQVIYAIAVSKG